MSEIKEREWKDQFGHHVEITATSPDGMIHSETVTKSPHWGWGEGRIERARSRVYQAALQGRSSNQ